MSAVVQHMTQSIDQTYTVRVPKSCVRDDDRFNRARGLTLYVVACICDREGLPMPAPNDRVESGFCDEDGHPRMEGDATHFGWTLIGSPEGGQS